MSETYAILWKPDRLSPEPKSDLIRRFDTPGSPSGGNAPRLLVEQLDDRQLGEVMRAPQLGAIAPKMPIKLIGPLPVSSGSDTEAWGIEAVGAVASGYSGQGVKVAILDTGIERGHPAFSGIRIVEEDFSGTGNGDRQGHGTHCAGTIFGRDVGGTRIGVARGVDEALIGKVLDDNGGGSSEMIFAGLQWAIQQNANIISLSLGLDFPGAVAERINAGWPPDLAMSWALESYQKNMRMFDALVGMAKARAPFGGDPIVIAAAGNESRRLVNPSYRIAACLPSAIPDVVSVAAVKRSGSRMAVAEFSNSSPVVAAPGVEINSAWIGGGLHSLSGTSMACPHAAGVAALWAQALRESGRGSSGAGVRSNLVAQARIDVFEGSSELVDVGFGLVTAP
jgi:subtilisin family serine protease